MSVAQTTATAEAAAATTTTAASTDTSHRFSCCLNLSEWKPTDPPIATTAPWTFGRNQPAGMSPRRRRRRRDANFSSLVLPTSYARFFSEFIYFIFYFLFLWFFLFNQPARCNFHFTCDFPGLQCDLQLNKSEIIWAHGSQCVNITIESFIQSRWTIAFAIRRPPIWCSLIRFPISSTYIRADWLALMRTLTGVFGCGLCATQTLCIKCFSPASILILATNLFSD